MHFSLKKKKIISYSSSEEISKCKSICNPKQWKTNKKWVGQMGVYKFEKLVRNEFDTRWIFVRNEIIHTHGFQTNSTLSYTLHDMAAKKPKKKKVSRKGVGNGIRSYSYVEISG